jgi:heme exporter protein B
MMNTLYAVIRRELLLAFRRKSDLINMLFFFLLVAILFPLGVGPEPALLRSMAPGIVWVAALLASILALGRLFGPDYADGTLEQMLLSREPLTVIVCGKLVAHWLVSGLPVVLLAPLLGVQFGLPHDAVAVLLLSLVLGTPALSLLGSIGAALALGAPAGAMLTSLLVLPLCVPMLIFGAGAVGAEAAGAGSAYLLLLGGVSCSALALAPLATAAALRIALE